MKADIRTCRFNMRTYHLQVYIIQSKTRKKEIFDGYLICDIKVSETETNCGFSSNWYCWQTINPNLMNDVFSESLTTQVLL